MNDRTRAMALLTVHLESRRPADAIPLNVKEWNDLARWLRERELTPESLIRGDPSGSLAGWESKSPNLERLLKLLDRGYALGAAIDRWESTGIWLVNRSNDADYPERLKQRLRGSAPILLFGCGEPSIAHRRGVAIAGSRDASRTDEALAYHLARRIAEHGSLVISGGAKGIDQEAANGAYDAHGQVASVLAHSLLQLVARKKEREQIELGNLLLLTPYSPETGFSTGNAHGRNKLIYGLSDAAIAVCSTNGSGGTFAGATENLKRGWVPLWVGDNRSNPDPHSGNHALFEAGARWLPALNDLNIDSLFNPATTPT